MKKFIIKKAVVLCSTFLGMMLLVCANSGSSVMMHEEKMPDGLERFRKIK